MTHAIHVMEAFDTHSHFETHNQDRVLYEYIKWHKDLRRWVHPNGRVELVGAYRIPDSDRFFVVYKIVFSSKSMFNKMKLLDEYQYAMDFIERLVETYESNFEWVSPEYSYRLVGSDHELQNS